MPSSTPSLFEDDPTVTIPTGLVRRSVRLSDSKQAKIVNRLLAQVESLRLQLDAEKRRLDDALIFHAAHVQPRADRIIAMRAQVVRALARFLDDRRVGKPGRRVLGDILLEQLDEIFSHDPAPDEDLRTLFERLHGVGYDQVVQEDLDDARSDMSAFFEALGLDVEIPDLRPDMTEEELAASAAEMADGMRHKEPHAAGAPPLRKTKRQLREEAKSERQAQLRKISIGAVFKRLVKALHPDLEQDAMVREQKSGVMQQVTTAYAAGDLHTLLRLEFECLGGGHDAARRSDETLQAYAAVLKQQAAQTRAAIMDLPFQPRYASLLDVTDAFGMPARIHGPSEVQRLDAVIVSLNAALERLSDEGQALEEARELIREHRHVRGRVGMRSMLKASRS